MLSFAMIPAVIRAATRLGILDYPVDERRVHRTPVPRLGGVAVFVATAGATAAMVIGEWSSAGIAPVLPLGRLLPGLAIGASIVFLTGLLDDVRGVAPRFKLVAQTAAGLVVVAYGLAPTAIALGPGGGELYIGWLGVPLLLLWIVGITNAFNLIDGVDGLAGTFALIGLITCAATDYLLHGPSVLTLTVAMTGAVLAFLRFNRNPAKIFLGDSGSMTIGFFLAVRSVVSASDDNGTVYFLIPLVALAFPITDTFVAILRRWVRGHPLSRADGRHVHHQLLALGLSPRRTVEALCIAFTGFAVVGLSVVFAPPKFTLALLGGATILGFTTILYGVRFLQYSEFVHLGASIASVVRSARSVVQHKVLTDELATRIARAGTLQELDELLRASSEDVGVLQVELLAGRRNFVGPEEQMISPADSLPWRLDYRMGLGDAERRELLLRVWCNSPAEGIAHGSAERFAMRVGPALERWFLAHPELVANLPEPATDPKERSARISGETHRPRARH